MDCYVFNIECINRFHYFSFTIEGIIEEVNLAKIVNNWLRPYFWDTSDECLPLENQQTSISCNLFLNVQSEKSGSLMFSFFIFSFGYHFFLFFQK